MTTAEVIRELSGMPQDLPVYVCIHGEAHIAQNIWSHINAGPCSLDDAIVIDSEESYRKKKELPC